MKIQVRWPKESNVSPDDLIISYYKPEFVYVHERLWAVNLKVSTVHEALLHSSSVIWKILEEGDRVPGHRPYAVRSFISDGESDEALEFLNEFLTLYDGRTGYLDEAMKQAINDIQLIPGPFSDKHIGWIRHDLTNCLTFGTEVTRTTGGQFRKTSMPKTPQPHIRLVWIRGEPRKERKLYTRKSKAGST